jgi:multidrug efflux pump subunit AcrB
LLGTPFAIFGAFLALYLARMTSTSYELNIFAQIALVMLIGMAAKNAILIVEFANLEFNKGLSLFDAAVKAANLRFRPILMTAFSFILGVLPLVVAIRCRRRSTGGHGGGSIGRHGPGHHAGRVFLPHAVCFHRKDCRV